MSERRRAVVAGWWLVVGAVAAILVAGVWLAFGPIVASAHQVTATSVDQPTSDTTSAEQVSVRGLGWPNAAAISAAPTLLTLPALAARRRRRAAIATRATAATLLTGLVLLAGMSVGLFYAPAAALMAAAAVLAVDSPPRGMASTHDGPT